MPTKVNCVWVMCDHNSKHQQRGETGECLFDGEIDLITPDERQLDRILLDECEGVESDEILMCDQCTFGR